MDHAEREVYLEYLGITESDLEGMINPFERRTDKDLKEPHLHVLRLMRTPDYFYYTCKVLLNIELPPFQCVILKEMWSRRFPMLIGSRGLGKSFLLGLYSVLRALLKQGSKVVICGSGFRQAKTVFNYAENIWHNSPMLQSLVADTARGGPEHGADRWVLRLGESTIVALPIGSGEKIRGERANCIVCDEFGSVGEEIFETVISGFGVVNLSPIEQMKKAARRRVMKRKGASTESSQERDRNNSEGNQVIISGTAYWQFNHFCRYWNKWRTIIECRGNQEEMRKRLGETLDETLDWRDFMVIRFPYTMIPDGYYDIAQIARSRATIHAGTFQNEFGACVVPDTIVQTDSGCKKIVDIKVGDKVLTHKGRFRNVVETMNRTYKGPIVRYKTCGHDQEVLVTPEHPYWDGDDRWVEASEISSTKVANVRELLGTTEIDIRPIVRDYLECDGKIYPRPGNSKLSRDEFAACRNATGPVTEIAATLGLPYGSVWSARASRGERYNSIPPVIKLDKNLGLVLGYYAAEGNSGSSGRAIEFALDGHVDVVLEDFINQLSEAAKAAFGIEPKQYKRESSNVCNVVITQSLIRDFVCWACPGLSGTKKIRPEILWSNEEFLQGFIEGYWNGDGHISCLSSASTNSIDLAYQIRAAFSYFGVSLSIRELPPRMTIIRGVNRLCKKSYILACNGSNHRKMKNLLRNGEEGTTNHARQQIINNGNHSNLPVVEVKHEYYAGLVYNLEVDEDNSYTISNATVHNCFSSDSNGFYKRSLIETCTTSQSNPITPDVDGARSVWFNAVTRGNSSCNYIMGVDPAAEQDNFAIVILEIHEDHHRVVHCWTTNKQKFNAKSKGKLIEDETYYGYCARKIRELLRVFPCELISLDAQGGGQNGVLEALHDSKHMKPGERPIWSITPDHPLSDGKTRDSDDYPGLHIVELVSFSDSKWTSGANHGMKKDFEQRTLLFPQRDAVTLSEAFLKDTAENRLFDTLEDCVDEIDELKDELSTITFSQTPGTLRDKWDTPEVKIAGSKKGRMRKDRYSALLMANYAARRLHRQVEAPEYKPHGGFADLIDPGKEDSEMYSYAPDWFTKEGAGSVHEHYGWVTQSSV